MQVQLKQNNWNIGNKEELKNERIGPEKLKCIIDQYQQPGVSDSPNPNFRALIAPVAAVQNCTSMARIVIKIAVVFSRTIHSTHFGKRNLQG